MKEPELFKDPRKGKNYKKPKPSARRGRAMKRYFQIKKESFCYHCSVYGSSVWNSSPLDEIAIENIESIQVENSETEVKIRIIYAEEGRNFKEILVKSENKEVITKFFIILKYLRQYNSHVYGP